MADDRGLSNLEERIGAVDQWINRIATIGEVREMQPELLRGVLEAHGADFDISPEEIASLSEYTNKGRADWMRAVWGERFTEYKTWAGEYVAEYEAQAKTELPKLESSGSKTSGMIQFFGELTSFAVGATSLEDFRRYTEARIFNGKMWAEGRREKRIRVELPVPGKPGQTEPKRLSSIPPEFPKRAWDKIKGWKNPK